MQCSCASPGNKPEKYNVPCQTDDDRRGFFTYLATEYNPSAPLDKYERAFHRKMQFSKYKDDRYNPDIKFWGVSRQYLHNGILATLQNYFDESGKHLFGKTVNKLSICDVRLSAFVSEDCRDSMPDGVTYIAQLIAKNPQIRKISLQRTLLGDAEARMLLDALQTNTHLQKLNVRGNSISAQLHQKIDAKLAANRAIPKT